jgi:arylsulfatase A
MLTRFFCFLLLLLGFGCTTPDTALPPAPPNIVIVFSDDQGYGDLGSYGGDHVTTPALDQLAAEGTRFTHFRVAQAVCSASRAALLTGCYPNRVGIRAALGPGAANGIRAEETTLAEMLGARGYQTAMVGKWHLGDKGKFLPTQHGFDSYYGVPYSHDMWSSHPVPHMRQYFPDKVPLFRDTMLLDSLLDFTTLTRDYNEEALKVIRQHNADDGSLFLYLAHSLPHVPLYEDPSYGPATGKGLYADVIGEIDHGVAEIRLALAENGMAENTLIIYSSDNGPWLSYGGHAGRSGGLREGKATSFEGGVRVPLITYLPGSTAAGKVSDAPLMSIDLLPSLATLTGATLPENYLDGNDRLDDFLGKTTGASPDPYPIYWLDGLDAIISASGRWKLHFPHKYPTLPADQPITNDGYPVSYRTDSIGLSLFDLHSDPKEQENVLAAWPDTVAQLTSFAQGYREAIGDSHTKTEGKEVRR